MIGIVMIPLAATCVFAAGAYSQRMATESQSPQRNVVEVRAIYTDRRGSDAAEELAEAAASHDDETVRLHSPGGPQTALPVRAFAFNPHPFSLSIFREEHRALDAVTRAIPLSRGPPHVA